MNSNNKYKNPNTKIIFIISGFIIVIIFFVVFFKSELIISGNKTLDTDVEFKRELDMIDRYMTIIQNQSYSLIDSSFMEVTYHEEFIRDNYIEALEKWDSLFGDLKSYKKRRFRKKTNYRITNEDEILVFEFKNKRSKYRTSETIAMVRNKENRFFKITSHNVSSKNMQAALEAFQEIEEMKTKMKK